MARFRVTAFADEAASSLEEQIAVLQSKNIRAIELRCVNQNKICDITPDEAGRIKFALDNADISVSSIGSRYGKDRFNFEAFKQTIEVAKVLSVKFLRLFSFYDDYKEQYMDAIRIMARYAKENGVVCCLENENRTNATTSEECLEILQAIPDLGFVFDFGNFLEAKIDTWTAYQLLKQYITYFHLKDYSNEVGSMAPVGFGDGRIVEILKDFDQSKNGFYWLSLEPHLYECPQYANRSEAFCVAVEALKQAIEVVQPIRLGIIGYGNMGAPFGNERLTPCVPANARRLSCRTHRSSDHKINFAVRPEHRHAARNRARTQRNGRRSLVPRAKYPQPIGGRRADALRPRFFCTGRKPERQRKLQMAH
jgi:sugar phosphate isomerase/epimerase